MPSTISASKSTLDQGQSSSLTSTAPSGGTSPYSYQWLQKAPGASTYTAITGATSNAYSFSSTGVAAGTYSFELNATDSATTNMTVTSNAISVMVNNALAAPTASGPIAVNQGQAFTLNSTSVTTGTGPYVYQWFSEAPTANSYSPISDAISPSYNYITTSATALGNWSFIIQVSDATGSSVNSTATIVPVNTVLVAPVITSDASTITAGQSNVQFSSTAITTGSAPYTYQWLAKAPSSDYAAVGTNSSTYSFVTTSSTAAGSWNFMVQVTDASGAAISSSSIAVTVNPAPATPTPTAVVTPHPTATPTPSPTPTPKITSTPTNTPTTSPTPNGGANSNVDAYLIGGIIAIVVVIVVLAIFMIQRKKKMQTNSTKKPK